MSQTRIVLASKHKPLADELLRVTGIDSLSSLFVIFLTRYGSHLRTSWNVSRISTEHEQPLQSSPTVNPTSAPVPVIQSEPTLPQEPEQIDPVIARLAAIVDIF